jgi:Rrf2 family transcriptional regulator, nitric oxide-sensitive transcriptional repressor
MRLTTKTNIAVRVLMACAVNENIILRSAEIATACNASLNHLLQVVNALQSHGFVDTTRGRSGGLRLSRAATKISIGDVFRALESGVPFAECFAPETNTCPLAATCRLRGYLQRAVEAFYHELDMVTLDDLTRGNCGLTALLEVPDNLRRNCAQNVSA